MLDSNPPITIKEARKIMGLKINNYSDEEIEFLIEELNKLAKEYIRSSQTVS